MKNNTDKYAALSPDILAILKDKHTEKPFSGKYCNHTENGTYLCRGCGIALFRANNQFHASCGWPSFDDSIKNNVKAMPDQDGIRTEIVCGQCAAHLGHVFHGEQLTTKNTRHCVNSCSLEFVPSLTVTQTEEAIVAGGCFWGVQHLLQSLKGVLLTEVGYTEGDTSYPTYFQVCSQTTGHVEAVRIVFDTTLLSYEDLIYYFMEIHDPTQQNGQGPDRGSQYLSRLYYFNDTQRMIAEKTICLLIEKNYEITTKIKPVSIFWPAEEDHQRYYEKTKQAPYCHQHVKRF
ncbi:MAG: bifunctional methionine sulfoxide reductase B/A protein [Coxiellaceae bacterium]|nr:bifunctional methionine sulfoxide reductase B/A protein [Coxiellaceae bacterium]